MAKITNKSLINVGTELTLDTGAKTFTLNVAGNLVAKDWVTIQALYSKLIDLWTTTTYNKFEFPMYTIDAKSGQFIFGFDGWTYSWWKPADDATRQRLRDWGWSEFSSAWVLNRQSVWVVSLWSVSAGSQLYYQKVSAGASADFTFTDASNEGIQVFGDASNGNFDSRAFFKSYVREYAKKYKDSVLWDTGQVATGAYTVNMLLSNEDDLDITAIDGNVSTLAPYTDIKIKYFATAFVKDVDSASSRSFGIVIDVWTNSWVDGSAPGWASVLTTATGGMTINQFSGGILKMYSGTNKNVSYPIVSNTATTITVTWTIAVGSAMSFVATPSVPVVATLQEIYTKIQYQLRQNSNINSISGTVTGKIWSLLLNFVGSALKCGFFAPTNPNGGWSGVMVEGIKSADLNSITFHDNSGIARDYPFSSAGVINFNSFLTSGVTGYYRLYFTDLPGVLDYGLTGAITVNDKDWNPIQGTISGASIAFTFDYTNNVQGWRTAGTNASVTLVAGNAGVAKPVVVTGTLTASKSISVTATAEQDRGYL